MILISACLAGVNCRYSGDSSKIEKIMKLVREKKAVLVCPEQLGGLSTPRLPCEIIDGSGEDVLNGKARVVNKEGEDVTAQFVKGAEETLEMAKMYDIKKAILKARSPSCGCGMIYDGSFTGRKKEGDGVLVALLKRNGIEVFDEQNYRE